MQRPNWFLGFPLDGAFVLELPPLPPQFRRFHPEDVHCTLAFLGPCGEDGARHAFGELERLLEQTPLPACELSLGEVVPMGGSRQRYTALSALLERGRAEISAAIARLRDPLLAVISRGPDTRPPKPHVSVARPRARVSEAQREAGLAWAEQLELREIAQRVDRIALYSWHEARHERLFRIVTERAL